MDGVRLSSTTTLIGLLDPDATAVGDGGGIVSAAPHPIEGGEQVARYFVDLAGQAPSNLTLLERTVNGQPGLVAQLDGVTGAVLAFDIAGDRIRHIWAVCNPAIGRQGRLAPAGRRPG